MAVSDLLLRAGSAAAQEAAVAGMAVGLEAGARALKNMTAKATLYVRVLGAEYNDTSGISTNEDVAALKGIAKMRKKESATLMGRAGQVVSRAVVLAGGAQRKVIEAETDFAMQASGFVPFHVQYNPSSLRMNSVGGKLRQYKSMGNDTMNSVQNTDKATSAYLTVQLVFEDINVNDAFGKTTFSDGGLSTSNALDMAASIKKNLQSNGYSVRKQVEGIIALLMIKRTRQVIFVWNNMFFHGELISVNANYTMFNKQGHPIRAVVEMQIQQNNNNATFKSDLAYWNDVFDEAFDSSLF